MDREEKLRLAREKLSKFQEKKNGPPPSSSSNPYPLTSTSPKPVSSPARIVVAQSNEIKENSSIAQTRMSLDRAPVTQFPFGISVPISVALDDGQSLEQVPLSLHPNSNENLNDQPEEETNAPSSWVGGFLGTLAAGIRAATDVNTNQEELLFKLPGAKPLGFSAAASREPLASVSYVQNTVSDTAEREEWQTEMERELEVKKTELEQQYQARVRDLESRLIHDESYQDVPIHLPQATDASLESWSDREEALRQEFLQETSNLLSQFSQERESLQLEHNLVQEELRRHLAEIQAQLLQPVTDLTLQSDQPPDFSGQSDRILDLELRENQILEQEQTLSAQMKDLDNRESVLTQCISANDNRAAELDNIQVQLREAQDALAAEKESFTFEKHENQENLKAEWEKLQYDRQLLQNQQHDFKSRTLQEFEQFRLTELETIRQGRAELEQDRIAFASQCQAEEYRLQLLRSEFEQWETSLKGQQAQLNQSQLDAQAHISHENAEIMRKREALEHAREQWNLERKQLLQEGSSAPSSSSPGKANASLLQLKWEDLQQERGKLHADREALNASKLAWMKEKADQERRDHEVELSLSKERLAIQHLNKELEEDRKAFAISVSQQQDAHERHVAEVNATLADERRRWEGKVFEDHQASVLEFNRKQTEFQHLCEEFKQKRESLYFDLEAQKAALNTERESLLAEKEQYKEEMTKVLASVRDQQLEIASKSPTKQRAALVHASSQANFVEQSLNPSPTTSRLQCNAIGAGLELSSSSNDEISQLTVRLEQERSAFMQSKRTKELELALKLQSVELTKMQLEREFGEKESALTAEVRKREAQLQLELTTFQMDQKAALEELERQREVLVTQRSELDAETVDVNRKLADIDSKLNSLSVGEERLAASTTVLGNRERELDERLVALAKECETVEAERLLLSEAHLFLAQQQAQLQKKFLHLRRAASGLPAIPHQSSNQPHSSTRPLSVPFPFAPSNAQADSMAFLRKMAVSVEPEGMSPSQTVYGGQMATIENPQINHLGQSQFSSPATPHGNTVAVRNASVNNHRQNSVVYPPASSTQSTGSAPPFAMPNPDYMKLMNTIITLTNINQSQGEERSIRGVDGDESSRYAESEVDPHDEEGWSPSVRGRTLPVPHQRRHEHRPISNHCTMDPQSNHRLDPVRMGKSLGSRRRDHAEGHHPHPHLDRIVVPSAHVDLASDLWSVEGVEYGGDGSSSRFEGFHDSRGRYGESHTGQRKGTAQSMRSASIPSVRGNTTSDVRNAQGYLMSRRGDDGLGAVGLHRKANTRRSRDG